MATSFSLGPSFVKLTTFASLLLCAITGALPVAFQGSEESGSSEEPANTTTCSYQSNLNELFIGLQVLQKYSIEKLELHLVSKHTRT